MVHGAPICTQEAMLRTHIVCLSSYFIDIISQHINVKLLLGDQHQNLFTNLFFICIDPLKPTLYINLKSKFYVTHN